MSSAQYEGGCACGALRYEVQGEELDIGDCHCRMCQRAVGAGFVTWATVSARRVTWRGQAQWWRSSAQAERGFCARCGTSLFFRAIPAGDTLDITVASFDAAAKLAPTFAIWTASRLPWVHLDPALVTYPDAGPDGSPAPVPVAHEGLRWQEGLPVDVVQLNELFTAVGFSRSADPADLQALLDGARWVISVWQGDALVGFVRAISDGVANAYVSTVAVRPDLQRRGIGRELMRRLMEGRDGVKFVLRASDAGEQLYRSMGYVEDPRILVRPRKG